MWLCTQLGFFSIVRKERDTFHIRARCREDLYRLSQAAGTGKPIASYAGSDYPWRILCSTADLPKFMSAQTASIDYGNFKSAIAASPTQHLKLSAYHDIHHWMVEWQKRHVFNTLTDIAARPPDSPYFQKDRDTIEKRSGLWLKALARYNQSAGFDLNAWITVWKAGGGHKFPGRN